MKTITFTKVGLPFGWLSNMSAHPVKYGGKEWKTTEALFQALRFDDDAIREEIRAQASPMTAKMKTKAKKSKMAIVPGSPEDIANMKTVLHLKIETYPELRKAIIDTEDALIIEDCTKRKASIWGAQLIDDEWKGENLLGKLWMELRDKMKIKFDDQLWIEITEGMALDMPIKRNAFINGAIVKLRIGGYGEHHTSEYDLNDPKSIEKMRKWFHEKYDELRQAKELVMKHTESPAHVEGSVD